MQKTRNSNIELLRIIAMVMILGLHVNFLAIGQPSTQEIVSSPIQSFIRLFAEYACIVGVNVFVLISGWFGIHYKPKEIVQFLFQSLFFSLIIFIPFAITGEVEVGRLNIMSSFLLYKNAYWFVWAYLVLYIMAPMLNTFIEKNDRQTLKDSYSCFLLCRLLRQYLRMLVSIKQDMILYLLLVCTFWQDISRYTKKTKANTSISSSLCFVHY